MNWKSSAHWLHGLIGASISGAATAVSGVLVSAATGTAVDWEMLGKCALGAAVAGAALYLKESPIPPEE